MGNHINQKLIYSISIEDIQTVAQEELERNLTSEEIASLEDSIAENIDWYNAIAIAINHNIENKK